MSRVLRSFFTCVGAFGYNHVNSRDNNHYEQNNWYFDGWSTLWTVYYGIRYRIKNSVQDVEQKATIGTKNPKEKDHRHKINKGKTFCQTIMWYEVLRFSCLLKNNDIYEMLKKVGYIERLEVKWNYKYRTVRAKIRLTKEMEEIFLKGGSNNIALTKNERTYFFRMFDAKLNASAIKKKIWMASI